MKLPSNFQKNEMLRRLFGTYLISVWSWLKTNIPFVARDEPSLIQLDNDIQTSSPLGSFLVLCQNTGRKGLTLMLKRKLTLVLL